jgi:type I restriction enzyme, S subunit
MSEWVSKPLGEVADFVMGQSPSASAINTSEIGLPFLQGSAEFGDRSPNARQFVDPPLKIAPQGSVLVSVRAPVGELNHADRAYGIGRGLAAIVGRRQSGRFIGYAVELAASWLHRRSQGSTFLAVGSTDLRTLPIVVSLDPDVCERAAGIIALIDQQIERTRELIAKQKQVRAGLMQDLLTRGVDESGRLRPPREEASHLYFESRVGWIPTGWTARPLEACATSFVDGPFGSNLKTEHYVDEPGVRVVRLQNIQAGRYNDSDRMWISDAHARRLSKHNVLPGDVLIASLGDETYEAGRCCMYPLDLHAAVSKADCFRLRPNSEVVSAAFLVAGLNSWALKRQKTRVLQGVTRQRINLGNCRRMLVPIAPTEEQHRIDLVVEAADKVLSQEKQALVELRQRRVGLMHDLLSGLHGMRVPLKGRAA